MLKPHQKLGYILLLAFICATFCCINPQIRSVIIPNRKYNFPPSSGPVELCESVPYRDFLILGEVHVHGGLYNTKNDVMERLKQEARSIGANAVINIEYTDRRHGGFAIGTAIKWEQEDYQYDYDW